MQENLRVNRFTLVETFFLEVNVENSNFCQFMSDFFFRKFVELRECGIKNTFFH